MLLQLEKQLPAEQLFTPWPSWTPLNLCYAAGLDLAARQDSFNLIIKVIRLR
jgi:hypothetical protein